MTPLRQALEAALVDDPDDLAAHMAYGDYLAEQGDPRGEFAQVQLALERGEALHGREAELLERHRDEWLGPLAPFVAAKDVTFRRGWVDTLRVRGLTAGFADALIGAGETRLLRSVTFLSGDDAPLETIRFGNVRSLTLGDLEGDDGFRPFPNDLFTLTFISQLPRLEEVHLNVHQFPFFLEGLLSAPLRVLRVDNGVLTDGGVRDITRGRLLDGLNVLQIWNARFGDAGAILLAQHPAMKQLDLLDVSFNWLTEAGVAALREACPNVVAEYQTTEADDVDEFELTLE